MSLIVRAFFVVAISVGTTGIAYAGWKGPIEVVKLGFGNQPMQVALEHGDTEDDFPQNFTVDKDGNILLADSGNVRVQVFSQKGNLKNSIKPINLPAGIFGWPLQWTLLSNSRVMLKRGNRYQIYNYDGSLKNEFTGVATQIAEIATLSDDSIVVYKDDEKQYYQYSSAGKLINTFTTRPSELFYKRDARGFIYIISDKLVRKLSDCKKVLAELLIPNDQSKIVRPGGKGQDEVRQLIAEYGEPVVAPNGDIYTWKRTPDIYSIIKWAWLENNITTSPSCKDEDHLRK